MGKSLGASHPRFLTLPGSVTFLLLWVGVMARHSDCLAYARLDPLLLPTMLELVLLFPSLCIGCYTNCRHQWILWTVANSTFSQGLQGTYDTASKAALENEFGTSVDDEVIKQILENGETQTSEVSTIYSRLIATVQLTHHRCPSVKVPRTTPRVPWLPTRNVNSRRSGNVEEIISGDVFDDWGLAARKNHRSEMVGERSPMVGGYA